MPDTEIVLAGLNEALREAARTFHSAALSQLSRLWSSHTGETLPEVLDHKAPLIASLANALPPPHKFLPRRELAGEIEWAPSGGPDPPEPVPGRDGARAFGPFEDEHGTRPDGHSPVGRRGVRPAEGVAPQARECRRRSGICGVPRPHAG